MASLKEKGLKPKLLLHSCCAPCSTRCIEALFDCFDITVFYYNPNITDNAEYLKRKEEQIKFLTTAYKGEVKFLEGDYDVENFYALANGLEGEKEGGERCHKCYELRLRRTAITAKNGNFDFFTTTLSVSPYKNATYLNEIGFSLDEEIGVNYLPADFKKEEGYKRSIELSKIYGLYRQDYCGCEFSKLNMNK